MHEGRGTGENVSPRVTHDGGRTVATANGTHQTAQSAATGAAVGRGHVPVALATVTSPATPAPEGRAGGDSEGVGAARQENGSPDPEGAGGGGWGEEKENGGRSGHAQASPTRLPKSPPRPSDFVPTSPVVKNPPRAEDFAVSPRSPARVKVKAGSGQATDVGGRGDEEVEGEEVEGKEVEGGEVEGEEAESAVEGEEEVGAEAGCGVESGEGEDDERSVSSETKRKRQTVEEQEDSEIEETRLSKGFGFTVRNRTDAYEVNSNAALLLQDMSPSLSKRAGGLLARKARLRRGLI